MSAQCCVYAQDPTNLFEPHKSFIRPHGKDRQRNKHISFEEKIHNIPVKNCAFTEYIAFTDFIDNSDLILT